MAIEQYIQTKILDDLKIWSNDKPLDTISDDDLLLYVTHYMPIEFASDEKEILEWLKKLKNKGENNA